VIHYFKSKRFFALLDDADIVAAPPLRIISFQKSMVALGCLGSCLGSAFS